MTVLLSVLALVSACLYLRAEHQGFQRQGYLFKPLTTALIVLVALLAPAPVSPFYQAAIVLGLLFSLAGDVFLMLPSDRFVAGLASFLAAHLAYVAAFASETGLVLAPWSLLPLLVCGGVLLRVLWPHLGRMRGPVLVYGLVIVAMAWQAFEFWNQANTRGALLAFLGAGAFVISDSVLAINRFISKFKGAQMVIMSTYYAAQWLIAMSV